MLVFCLPQKMIAHAETSPLNLTLFDAHVNLPALKPKQQCRLGRSQLSHYCHPFDKTYKTPDDFSNVLHAINSYC